jgi:hypothetical protein
VPDMTLLSTITNDAINDNLKQRFFNQEIYVSGLHRLGDIGADTRSDVYRSCAHLGQPFSRWVELAHHCSLKTTVC